MRCEVVVEVVSESNAESGSFLYTSYDLILIDSFQPSHMPLGLAFSTSVNAGRAQTQTKILPKDQGRVLQRVTVPLNYLGFNVLVGQIRSIGILELRLSVLRLPKRHPSLTRFDTTFG